MTFKRKFAPKTLYISTAAIALVIATGVVIAYATNERPTTPDVSDYSLVFQDEFNGSTLDESKWTTCYDWYSDYANGCTNHGNDELQWYTEDQVTVTDGTVVLTAEAEPLLGLDGNGNPYGYPYRSGMLTTGKPTPSSDAKWVNQYGYYEARIYNPDGQGVWPAFWLLPEGDQWPPEIDIMEQTGDAPNDVITNYFWKPPGGTQAQDSQIHTSNESFAYGWHTYAVNWQEGSIDWYIDGELIRSVENSNVPSEPLKIAFTLAVGGNLPGAPDESTEFPATMMIDYVRVYMKD